MKIKSKADAKFVKDQMAPYETMRIQVDVMEYVYFTANGYQVFYDGECGEIPARSVKDWCSKLYEIRKYYNASRYAREI